MKVTANYGDPVSGLIDKVLKNGFVTVKNNKELSVEEFGSFAKSLGKPLVTERHIIDDGRFIQQIKATELLAAGEVEWHNDWSYGRGDYFWTVLYNKKNAHITPTTFIDMKIALEELDTSDDLDGIDGYYYPPKHLHYCFTEKQLRVLTKQNIHRPIKFTHPYTSEEVLYFSPGTLVKTSKPVNIDKLLTHCLQFKWDYNWNDNDIIIWDNIRTMHKRCEYSGNREIWRTQFKILQ